MPICPHCHEDHELKALEVEAALSLADTIATAVIVEAIPRAKISPRAAILAMLLVAVRVVEDHDASVTTWSPAKIEDPLDPLFDSLHLAKDVLYGLRVEGADKARGRHTQRHTH